MIVNNEGIIMSKAKQRGTLSAPLANALSRLSSTGKTAFELGDFAEVMDADRVRARKALHQR